MRARLEAIRPEVDRILASLAQGAESDADVAFLRSIWAHLQGRPNPKGAAAIVRIDGELILGGMARLPSPESWIDAWVAEHGLAFAACACAEVDRISAVRSTPGQFHLGYGQRYGYSEHASWVLDAPGRRMRALLAAAEEPRYAEAVAELANHRKGVMQSLVVSYLVPTRQDWVDECLAIPASTAEEQRLLWCIAGSEGQIAGFDPHPPYEPWLPDFDFLPGLVATMVDAIGPGIAPALAKAVDAAREVKARKPYLEAL
ncbi:hypothetical protein ACFQ07_17070, partial [Actinomadura adrarensis]